MRNAPSSRSASSFSQALVSSIVGLLLTLGLALLVAMAWQGMASTERAARQQIAETLARSTGRLQALVHHAELTAASVERVARTDEIRSSTLLPAMQTLLAAFEQQPDLSYLGVVIPQTGEYGNLERTVDGTVLLWLFPGNRNVDPTVRNFVLTDKGFAPRAAYPTDGYDPRTRPFYRAALEDGKENGTWMPAYRWIIHNDPREDLWGFSYVKALRDKDGKLLCVIDTDFDMPALNRFLRSLSGEYHAQLRIVELDDAPHLIGAPGASAVPLPLPPELQPLLRATADGAMSVDRMSLGGNPEWVAARRIALKGGISWLLVVSRPAPLIEAPLRRQLYEVLGMGLAIALGLVLLSIRIAQRFGKPLAELERRVSAIGQPASDARQAGKSSSVDFFLETRRLSASLDRMIAERGHAEENLRTLAMYDHLTGLANRSLIEEQITQAIARARQEGTLLALLYIDLDRFKVINDGYGHLFGDAVLVAVGRQLVEMVRPHDTVARLGGDEFLILLTQVRRPEAAGSIARKIVASLDSPLVVQGRKIHLSGSIGISVFPQDGESGETLIDNADMAMYRAKDLGRNTWQSFTLGMGLEAQYRVDLEIKLRAAAGAGQLRLVYQPKVQVDSGRITGCEALLRWNHPELGEVPPNQFIPIAEDSGLIVPIGDWVLRTACRQARHWIDAGLPSVCVAVNLSVRQFLQQDVVNWVTHTLRECGLPAECLELELTESLIAQDTEKVIETINAIKKLGVKLSIDDFGTGYSSLNYLKRFRVDTLKIDQSFVRNMLIENEDEAIVQAMIALAHNLKFKVIAEGVETEDHYRFLCRHRCDEIQGYYFSKPVDPEEFADMLREDKRLI